MVSQVSQPANFSFSGFIRLTRLGNLLIIVAAQYFAALCLLKNVSLVNSNLFILSLSTVFIAAAGYIINDYYDVKIDLINKPDRVVVGKVLKRRVAMIAHTVLSVTGIGLGLLLSYKVALLNLACALLLWAYSNQLKRMPFIGNFVVSLLTGLSIYVVSLYFDPGNKLILAYSLFAFFFTFIREVVKDMEDMKGDAEFGCQTLPIVWGIRKTKGFLFIVSLVFLLSVGYILFQIVGFWLLLFLIVPLAVLFYKLRSADTTSHYRYLSGYCKLIMLLGIASMIFFYQT